MAKSKEQKRQEAEERQAKYDALTLQEKWDLMIAKNRQSGGKSKKVAHKLLKQMNIIADKYEEARLAKQKHKKSK
jgi:ribosome-binding protein aMBF1 (putative translation factor)